MVNVQNINFDKKSWLNSYLSFWTPLASILKGWRQSENGIVVLIWINCIMWYPTNLYQKEFNFDRRFSFILWVIDKIIWVAQTND